MEIFLSGVQEITFTSSLAKYPVNPQQRLSKSITIELQWLEHLWNHENMFETEVVPANECLS